MANQSARTIWIIYKNPIAHAYKFKRFHEIWKNIKKAVFIEL